MRIAVCLSGQPRTIKYCIKSLSSYFEGADFFCHIWDTNTYKVKNNETLTLNFESCNRHEILQSLLLLHPKRYLIESESILNAQRRFLYDHMFYSKMQSINMKTQYEIDNDFRYDWVVKARYDLIFPSSKKFMVNNFISNFNPNYDLFTSHTGRMFMNEYNHINISDVMYYGNSTTMDIMSNLYWHIQQESLHCNINDVHNLGPGAWISDFIATNNLRFYEDFENLQDVIYRYEAIPLDPEKDFTKIEKIHESIYK